MEALEARLKSQVEVLNPLALVDWEHPPSEELVDTSRFAGVIGALLAQQKAVAPTIDFLAPRKSVVPQNPKRRRLVILAAGGVLAIVVGAASYAMQISDLNRKLALARTEDSLLTTTVKRGEGVLKSATLIQEWLDGQPQWLDEWDDLRSRMPGTDRLYLTSLRLDPQSGTAQGPGPGQTRGQGRGRIKIEGFARKQADVMELNQKLVGERVKYEVLPHGTRQAKNDEHYPWKFEVELLLKRPEKAMGATGRP